MYADMDSFSPKRHEYSGKENLERLWAHGQRKQKWGSRGAMVLIDGPQNASRKDQGQRDPTDVNRGSWRKG